MANMPIQDQQRCQRGMMRTSAALFGGVPGVLKTDLLAAVQAADAWIDANAGSYNAALPAAFRNNATIPQKAFLLTVVIAARYGVGLLQQLVGGNVD